MNNKVIIKSTFPKILLVCFIATFILINKAVAKSEYTIHPDAKKLIDVWISAQLAYEQIPYLSLSYTKEQSSWDSTYGHISLNKKIQANDDSIASICSATKVFTATAIMKLVDQGKLHLDQKLTELLPEFSLKNNGIDNESIKLKHLLTHTSGLPRDTLHAYWGGPVHNFPNKKQFYNSLVQQKRLTGVDNEVVYSNIGFALLGLIIERATNMSYKNFIESEIFKPLDMSNSVVEMSESQYGVEHVIGYTAINRDRERKKASFYQTKAMQPAAGISSNAKDLAKFVKWQFREMQSNNIELMSANSLKIMYDTNHSEKGKTRGLGYQVVEDKAGNKWAMHGGICPGYSSFLKMNLTTKEGFSVVTSANKIRALAYVNDLNNIVSKSYEIKHINENRPGLGDYEGFYDLNPWNSEYYVGRWGDDLVLLYLPVDSIKYAMYQYRHIEGDIFQLIKDGKLLNEKIQFKRDEKGEVVSILNDGSYHFKLPK